LLALNHRHHTCTLFPYTTLFRSFPALGGIPAMAKIDKVLVGESLVGDGNEVAHVDLIMGPRGSAAEAAFCNSLTNNKDGFTSLLDRKSTRLNSSHVKNSYAVFCL